MQRSHTRKRRVVLEIPLARIGEIRPEPLSAGKQLPRGFAAREFEGVAEGRDGRLMVDYPALVDLEPEQIAPDLKQDRPVKNLRLFAEDSDAR